MQTQNPISCFLPPKLEEEEEATDFRADYYYTMRSTIRCCISCILPCGALDVIRIVHVDGRMEEIGGTVSAAEIMKAYPKHILKKPTSRFPDDVPGTNTDVASAAASTAPRILVVPPDAELKRGKIYFLIPVPSSSSKKPANKANAGDAARRRKREVQRAPPPPEIPKGSEFGRSNEIGVNDNTERYLSEVLREKVSPQRDRRRGRVGVWRPHLESISESALAAANAAGDDQ